MNFEKCCEAKKMHKGHNDNIGRRKNFKQKKSKLKLWHSYRKNSFNHTSQTQKEFFQIRILRSVSTCSLPTADFSLVSPNICTSFRIRFPVASLTTC